MAYGGEDILGYLPQLIRSFGPRKPRVVRDLMGLPAVLARVGQLELRLATVKKDIRKAQRLRFGVFYDEGRAVAGAANAVSRRDKCPFDHWCDHLLVVDTNAEPERGAPRAKVVGTYRLLRGDMADRAGGFYSSTEFRVETLVQRHPGTKFLELGRSCVRAEYRSKRVIELLWRGIGIYAAHHNIDVLIGCSSLPGTGAADVALPLSFAYHFAAADEAWQVKAVSGRALQMNLVPREAIDPRRALTTLPPLMKAYVRAGGGFASEAVVDHQFGTIDLFTVLPLARANAKYMTQFGGGTTPSLCN